MADQTRKVLEDVHDALLVENYRVIMDLSPSGAVTIHGIEGLNAWAARHGKRVVVSVTDANGNVDEAATVTPADLAVECVYCRPGFPCRAGGQCRKLRKNRPEVLLMPDLGGEG